MNPETDPRRVRKLARQREEANTNFRAFLKNCDLKSSTIDKIVHQLSAEVTPQIDCCACANCCLETAAEVMNKDIDRLASSLGTTRDEFIAKYLDFNKEEKSYWLKGPPCPFLVDKKCSVYGSRPEVCRSYPHLHKKEFTSRLLSVLENCSICPIVFNVYERLQSRLADEYEMWEENEGDLLDL